MVGAEKAYELSTVASDRTSLPLTKGNFVRQYVERQQYKLGFASDVGTSPRSKIELEPGCSRACDTVIAVHCPKEECSTKILLPITCN